MERLPGTGGARSTSIEFVRHVNDFLSGSLNDTLPSMPNVFAGVTIMLCMRVEQV